MFSLILLAFAAAGQIPQGYLQQADPIPDFWVSTPDGVESLLRAQVRKGSVQVIGKTAGGRPIHAVFYGSPRHGKGTTTYSGSMGLGDVRAFLGPDHAKKVYLAMAGVHGAEFEGIVGLANLIAVLETGKDLRGRPWQEIAGAAQKLDRVVLIPIVNLDGRSRVPARMLKHRGADPFVQEYLNTGGRPDGKLIGWPQCKEFIPLDFSRTQFPGGYPNDNGVNIQHDDFLGARQPETQALLDLVARERPNLTLNQHTGAQFAFMLRSFMQPAVMPAFDELYRRVHTRLTVEKLQATGDVAREADPARRRISAYNLDTALHLHSGALSVVTESPSHAFSSAKRNGEPFFHSPGDLLDAQLFIHAEAMKFLAPQEQKKEEVVAQATEDRTPRVAIILSSFKGSQDHDGSPLPGLADPQPVTTRLTGAQLSAMVAKAIEFGNLRNNNLKKLVGPEDWVTIKAAAGIDPRIPDAVKSHFQAARVTVVRGAEIDDPEAAETMEHPPPGLPLIPGRSVAYRVPKALLHCDKLISIGRLAPDGLSIANYLDFTRSRIDNRDATAFELFTFHPADYAILVGRNLILAGMEAPAVDAIGAAILGMKGLQTLRWADRKNLGSTDPDLIWTRGNQVEEAQKSARIR